MKKFHAIPVLNSRQKRCKGERKEAASHLGRNRGLNTHTAMSVKSAVGREGDVGVELTFKTMNLKKASMKEWGSSPSLED